MTTTPSPTLAAPAATRRWQKHADATDYPPLIRAYTDVSRAVKEAGLLTRARWFYVLVGAALALAFGAMWTGFVLLGPSWFQLLMAAALGMLLTQVAFLAHEAGHKQILASAPANDRLARILAGLIGMSFSWWDNKHTRHHANPNRVAKDPDVAVDTVSFLEEDAAKSRGLIRWITQRQGWLFFPLLTLEGLNLHVQSYRYLFSRGKVKHRWWEIALITARFAALLVPVFVFLPVGMALAFLGVQFAVFGVCMGASFAPNHKGMPIVAKDARLDFFSKQVRTSRNIAGGWWATTLLGGLNYQIEHHLFPNMPRPHLAKARRIVRRFCADLDVPYTETSLLRSYGIVIAHLNRVGLAARDPFECPITAEFRRS